MLFSLRSGKLQLFLCVSNPMWAEGSSFRFCHFFAAVNWLLSDCFGNGESFLVVCLWCFISVLDSLSWSFACFLGACLTVSSSLSCNLVHLCLVPFGLVILCELIWVLCCCCFLRQFVAIVVLVLVNDSLALGNLEPFFMKSTVMLLWFLCYLGFFAMVIHL